MGLKYKEFEKYEIKAPDYELSERDGGALEDAFFESKRYVKDGLYWKKRKPAKGLFKKKQVRIMITGDITCFEKQFAEAQTEDGYDFSYSFEKVRPVFEQADLVIGNLETMLFPQGPYRTEKYVSEQNFHCNAPLEFLDAIRRAGFDMVTNANNHDLDTGAIGLAETIDRIERFGLIQTGIFKEEKNHYELIDIDGFKVAITAFATEHNAKSCNLTEEGREFLLNDYSPEKAEKILKDARKNGAEIVICCMHWGRENKLKQNNEQRDLAREIAMMGYDCIVGSHPHVLQQFRKIKVEEGKFIPVFYSMGNFVSHNANNAKARSIIACLTLRRKSGRVLLDCTYVPIYTSNNFEEKKYVILPIDQNTQDARTKEKLELIRETVGERGQIDPEIKVQEYLENEEEPETMELPEKPVLEEIESFPFTFDDGRIIYTIFEDHVRADGLSENAWTQSYTVPEKFIGLPVTEIAEGAFRGRDRIKKINFRKTLSCISREAFRDCTGLEGFQLGDNIEAIRTSAFEGCTSLSAAVMGESVKRIESRAFAGCSRLRSVKISDSVTEIAEDAFAGAEQAVFYCGKDSYAKQFAKEHGYIAVDMELY